MSLLSAFVLLLTSFFSPEAEPGHVVKYSLNVEQSKMEWTGKAAIGAYSLTGSITPIGGEMYFDHGNINQGYIEIDMTSITHDEKKLVKHLKSDDFFDVKNHPTARFDLLGVKPAAENMNKVTGKLTVRGTTEQETCTAKIAQRGQDIVFSFFIEIDRTKYGVNHNSPTLFQNLKDDAVADNMNIKCELVFSPVTK